MKKLNQYTEAQKFKMIDQAEKLRAKGMYNKDIAKKLGLSIGQLYFLCGSDGLNYGRINKRKNRDAIIKKYKDKINVTMTFADVARETGHTRGSITKIFAGLVAPNVYATYTKKDIEFIKDPANSIETCMQKYKKAYSTIESIKTGRRKIKTVGDVKRIDGKLIK